MPASKLPRPLVPLGQIRLRAHRRWARRWLEVAERCAADGYERQRAEAIARYRVECTRIEWWEQRLPNDPEAPADGP